MTGFPALGLHIEKSRGLAPRQYPWIEASRFTTRVQIPLWALLLPVAIAALAAWKIAGTKQAGMCRHCGYDLTGNVSGCCPECGTPVGHQPSADR